MSQALSPLPHRYPHHETQTNRQPAKEGPDQSPVANLRAASVADPGDPGLLSLVEELTGGSAEFAALWNSHSVRGKTHEAKEFHHADVGSITLSYQAFDVNSAPGQQLVVYQAEPASPSEHALTLLGTLDATGRRDGDAFHKN